MATASTDQRGPLALCAVPLRRAPVAAFLRAWRVPPRGTAVVAAAQRPPSHVRDGWLDALADDQDGDLAAQLRATDSCMAHLVTTTTDRLVPRHLLAGDAGFLERNLGGWSPVWFGVLATLGSAAHDDPFLAVREELVRYGDEVADAAAEPGLVGSRVDTELGGPARVRAGAAALRRLRAGPPAQAVAALVGAARGAPVDGVEVPRLLALDELLEQLYRVELARRAADAEDAHERATALGRLQDAVADEHGLRLLLKGEYVMGRHRRSTVLLAEGLDVVVKQPAPEPDHTVALAARSHDGAEENWPEPVDGGRVVTSRGAVGRVLEAGAIDRLNAVFDRDVTFSVTLGLSVEPFAAGPTLAARARDEPAALTAARYDEVLVHHLVCEHMGVDNPDWHAANFMVTGAGLVHVDWGAARSIGSDERGPAAAAARLAQVRELAWSFQDEALAERTVALHDAAVADPDHLEELRARARRVVDG